MLVTIALATSQQKRAACFTLHLTLRYFLALFPRKEGPLKSCHFKYNLDDVIFPLFIRLMYASLRPSGFKFEKEESEKYRRWRLLTG